MSTYPIFFINHDALRRVSAFLFSYSGLSSFLACFRANSAVVLLISSDFVLPTSACPCLTGSLAVQQVSVLRNDFSHTFPYVVSFSLTPFFIPLIPSLFLLYMCFSYFQVFFPVSRSLSCTVSRRSCYDLFWSCCAH